VEQAQIACEAGANWIQYRCLSKFGEELLQDIHQVASICDDWGATLIIADHYNLLNEVDAQGVHMEDMDSDWIAIRKQIGRDKTLGASANTFEDIQRIAASDVVDYIGCGPFAVTRTKPNNYPLLGVEGYTDIVKKMKDAGIEIPLLAVGGVEIADVDVLLSTGVYGVAVAAAVNFSENPSRAFKEIYKKMY
jgi:thiamine-phosphate pyrophosphorylase